MLDDILFLSNEQLVDEMEDCSDDADREASHHRADEILIVALLRAVDDDFTHDQATRIIAAYKSLDRWYG